MSRWTKVDEFTSGRCNERAVTLHSDTESIREGLLVDSSNVPSSKMLTKRSTVATRDSRARAFTVEPSNRPILPAL